MMKNNDKTNYDDEEETRDRRFKHLLERHLGKNGTTILAFHSFILTFALLLIIFLNISFVQTLNDNNGGGNGELIDNPAIQNIKL